MRKLNKSICIPFIFLLISVSNLQAQKGIELDSANLKKLIEVSKETYTDEIMLIHKNKVIHHWKNQNCDSAYINTASMLKSWTGLVIGILIDKGLVNSEYDPVCDYLPEWENGCKHKVSIKNLLTMSAGYNRRSGARGILAEKDMNKYLINSELDTLPNIRFAYSNESAQLLGIIIEKLTNKTANEYFHEVLFDPLEMDSTSLAKDSAGNDIVFGGATTTLQDASKIGILMNNYGKYNGKQVVPEKWIQKTITPSEKASYYGYLWWLDNNSEDKNFAATGDFGQLTIVFPGLDLIYLRQQTCNKDISGNMKWMGPAFLNMIPAVIK